MSRQRRPVPTLITFTLGDKILKTISIVIPCYNEQENVVPLYEALRSMFASELPQYRYELLYIDNDSHDETRALIRGLCAQDPQVKAIFNAKNFGQFNSPYYAMLQSTGDATILMAADFQDPVEMIPQFVAAWEEGYKIAIGVKTHSKENPFMYALRGLYYKLIQKMSSVDQIAQFTGFGLYDRAFIDVMRQLNDPTPFLRGIVAELGFHRKEIPYTQPKRRAGITHNNLFFIGLLGEYILSINQRVMRRPLVVEEERLNFPEDAMIDGMADASRTEANAERTDHPLS